MKKSHKYPVIDMMHLMVGVSFLLGTIALIALVFTLIQAIVGSVAHAEDIVPEGYYETVTEGEFDLYDFADGNENDGEISEAEFPKAMVVTGDHVRERQAPNTNCTVTGHYDTGNIVSVVDLKDGWAELDNGCFVCADYLRDATDEDVAQDASAPQFSAEVQTYVSQYSDLAVVDLNAQTAYYFRNHELFAQGAVTTGRNGHKTPTGFYTVTQKRRNFDMGGSSEHHVDHAIFFNGNIAFHDAHWQKATKFGDTKYRPKHGSAGCVRTNDDLIQILWDYMRVDATRVLVVQSAN